MLITIVALGPFSLLELAYTFAKPADARNIVAFYVEANWGARHAAELTAYLGASQLKEKLSDPAQLPMRLNQESTAGADAAIGALTALQRELLERHASEQIHERFFSATERLPAALLLATDLQSGMLIGCAGVEASVVDRKRSFVIRRSATPLKSELKPDGSLPDGMEVRATLSCHAVAAHARRQGVGTELFRRAAAKAAEWDRGALLMMVEESDEEARAFYEGALGCKAAFRDGGATAMRPDWPSTQYSRDVLGVQRVPAPAVALEWLGT